MGQHAQAIREKHTARNVTLIVLAVLIVLLAIAAVFGMQLYKQAKSVKAHESQAISSLSAINDPAKLKDAVAGVHRAGSAADGAGQADCARFAMERLRKCRSSAVTSPLCKA